MEYRILGLGAEEFGDNARLQEALCELLAETFGRRSDQAELLLKMTSDKACNVLIACPEGEEMPVAFSAVKVLDAESSRHAFDAFGASADKIAGLRLGSFSVMAVASSHKGRGVAMELAQKQREWLLGQDVEVLCGVSWKHGGRDSSENLFRKAGFSELGRCLHFYRRYQEEGNYQCPRCLASQCECVALLFAQRLNAKRTAH